MSLNWKEINLILSELDLPGCQIQKAAQSAYDVMGLRVHGKGTTRQLLVSLAPGACRFHETFRAFPKSDRPLRFAEFLNSRIANGRIEAAEQLGNNRVIRILIRRGGERYRLYIRLWSNAANFIVTDDRGTILDAMRRLPGRGETGGVRYAPEEEACREQRSAGEYEVREIPGGGSFNEKIDAWYAERGGGLSLEALREQARRNIGGSVERIGAALEKLREKESEFGAAGRLREYGDIILANLALIKPGDAWLEAEDFFAPEKDSGGGETAGPRPAGEKIRIKLDPKKSPAAQAERYYEQYRKAKKGIADIREEIRAGEAELGELEGRLARLLEETNPLVLAKLLKSGGVKAGPFREQDKKRPGLSFRRGDWLIIVGRDAAENDALLRRHVKGNDLWLHARDFPGSHVFIKQRSGKTVPLEILLDAGNLAVFYSGGRNNGEGDLFYTQVKYLRRAKNSPRGLVIPTQEKNLHIRVDEKRLRELENCRIEKK
ncbi:MAG: NFACT family protein [Treponema sp.]|jgi:predicted ribosome quality control (RQC) complex YloA/Tae2 family protein|nr:NFACT family protein [Treponema sp.]